MIRLVADRGADVNSKSQGGYTPLHIAAMHNKESIMQFLIQDYHADVNIRDYSGRKARHYLKTGASSYMQQMLTGTPPTTSPPRIKLMALAETSPEKQHHHHHHHLSMFTSFRETIRNSLRIWGSADSLDEPDNAKLQPPKNRRTGVDYE
ncbi:ankyrin repeat domain-containing protein SOWAHC-like isoform X2 [Acanthaster planci]|uniref:Ankyrin repeat domain-containing protein SOWAHC-like isoform X2 n=1 Tax=Acanthaster planci TaxID=133434 RepID=A0A8B7XPV9_ACAPL|nr:ankyrin repeat domain-containing protein SOWAHC-like isoform X2 [Acanthaster planci]